MLNMKGTRLSGRRKGLKSGEKKGVCQEAPTKQNSNNNKKAWEGHENPSSRGKPRSRNLSRVIFFSIRLDDFDFVYPF